MPKPSLGDQELALLRYITEQAPVTVGEVAAGFGEPSGLARSTVETVMERLRKKGYLIRGRQEGVFRYTTTVAPQELMTGLVRQFVEQTLAGSLTPFVNYFSQQNRLSAAELRELERMVEKLQSPDKEARHARRNLDHPLE
ncbi:MAG TPA: BlaI/MecI/CopY family transcriptional regulator [Chthonomonadaceae bacterium]|nr:BlaI/MecI/CopY family transcriptional regulator [Chthonomonadaceae bacterium]